MIANLILAAGSSSRMRGRDKLLEQLNGEPILRVIVGRALSVSNTYVTLPAFDHPRRAAVPKGAQIVLVSGNMSDSIKAGIAALPDDITGVMILPADMPDVTAQDMAKIHATAASSDAPIIRAETEDGRAGHPTYFAASQFARFDELTGDRGAFRLTTGFEDQTLLVPLARDRARLDLDTPEDWAAYRAR